MKIIKGFIKLESSGGILLFCAAILALIATNSPLEPYYYELINTVFSFQVGEFKLSKPLVIWINDGLMAIYFLVIGLEIKHKYRDGTLKHFSNISLPIVGALGGLIVPALIYIFINKDDPTALRGWAIPSATDIAFSLGVLSLLGKRVPLTLKLFLSVLAISDDIGAIIIIAVFYTKDLALSSLGFALFFLGIMFVLNRMKIRKVSVYCFFGILVWLSVLKSGVHATLAGVMVAIAIPAIDVFDPKKSLIVQFENALHPWVTYLILPLFAFANAGVSLKGISIQSLLAPIPFGIAAGLFFGKQIGIFISCWLAKCLGVCRLPEGIHWCHIYGVAILGGIGFTMSLFIGGLAFQNQPFEYQQMLRLGVIGGSLLSGLFGYLLLKLTLKTLPAPS